MIPGYSNRFRRCLCLASDDDGDSNMIKAEKMTKRLEDFFLIRNGAELLKEMITFADGKDRKPILMLSAKEIAVATDNFAHAHKNFQWNSWHVGIYKGKLGSLAVTVNRGWKCKSPRSAINEVAILSRVNHPNVVNVVGCCFETDRPIVVYEDLPSETLALHLHEAGRLADGPSAAYIPWQNRLKILIQIAHALTYMHIGTSTPIIHMDVKPGNILLGECFAVKIFGFDFAVSMPLGETKMECQVGGTVGDADPVFLITGEVSEKTDVFSYGILMLEVLTGRRAFEYDEKREPGIGLIFLESAEFDREEEERRLISLLDPRVARDAKKEQLVACVRLTLRCVAKTWDERPEMKQVVEELWRNKGL